MSFPNLLYVVAAVTWLVAAIALALLYRKQASWRKTGLAIIFCTVGAATASYSFLTWRMGLERESALFVVGLAPHRFDEHLWFLKSYLGRELPQDPAEEDRPPGSMDWEKTFEAKHRDIQLELDNVVQNDFIRRYYSAWAVELTFHRQQLGTLAMSAPKGTESRLHREAFDAYVKRVESVKEFLVRLDAEMCSDTD